MKFSWTENYMETATKKIFGREGASDILKIVQSASSLPSKAT
jgi:hypothetical protein